MILTLQGQRYPICVIPQHFPSFILYNDRSSYRLLIFCVFFISIWYDDKFETFLKQNKSKLKTRKVKTPKHNVFVAIENMFQEMLG